MDPNTIEGKKIFKKMVTTRLNLEQVEKIESIASERKLTVTDIITEAIEEYIERKNAQLCSSCKTFNQPDAKYCKNCGLPLNPEGLKELEDAKNLVRRNPALLYQLAQEIEKK